MSTDWRNDPGWREFLDTRVGLTSFARVGEAAVEAYKRTVKAELAKLPLWTSEWDDSVRWQMADVLAVLEDG